MQKEEAKEILIERNRCYKEENMEHPLFIQAIDVAIQALSNDRPAPDRDGAEEVLVSTFDGHGNFSNIDDIFDAIEQKENRDYSKHLLLEAMTTHARNEVAKAVEQTNRGAAAIINMKDAEIESYQRELTEAKKRIQSLEESNKRLQFMVDNGLGDNDMINDNKPQ